MEVIEFFEQTLSKWSPKTNFYNLSKDWRTKFSLEERESFYFKTDSHWNAKGAINAFELLIPTFDIFANFNESSFNQADFEYIEKKDKSYQGDFDRQLQFQFPYKDTSGFYKMPDVDTITSWLYKDGELQKLSINEIYSSGIEETEMNYDKLYTKNYGYYKVVNSNALNRTKLIVIKDSYMNPMLPFFVTYFSQVEIVDPRYISSGDCYSLIEESDADAVLVLFNDGVVFGDMYNFNQ
jgi:hypothetical protein